jgi:hypothetical protein
MQRFSFQVFYTIIGERSSSKAERDKRQSAYHRAADWRQAVRFSMTNLAPKRRRRFRLEAVFMRLPDEAAPLDGWQAHICAGRVGWIVTDGRPRIEARRPAAGAGARRVN